MQTQDLPFQLIAWIKRQQEEEAAHRAKMVVKRHNEDKTFLEYVTVIVYKCWPKLNRHERTMMLSMVEQHNLHKNLSDRQRSAIIGIYIKNGGAW